MFVKLVYFVLCLPALVLSGDIGDRCTTPNGEVATCKPVIQCAPIKTALTNKAEGAVAFARKSHCGGVGASTLVCCGSVGVTTRFEKAPPCTTPNGESANCKPLSQCKIINDAVRTGNKDAVNFSKNSQCGYEDEALVCCGSDAYPLRSDLLPNRADCGEQKGDVRIHGGNVTQIFEFPWMVLLGYKNNDGTDAGFRCGGSIINSRYILTAAHCVSLLTYLEMRIDRVRLGEWRISTTSDCEAVEPGFPPNCADPVIDIKIEEKIIHPQYSRRKGKNDIALLRLERNMPFTNYIQPICLPVKESPDPEPGFKMQVAGWGATENSSNSDVKLKLEVPIVPRSDCNNKLRNIGGVDISQLCAGGDLGKDSCQGDSGGPLMRSASVVNLDAKPKWFQEGIVSRGMGCAVRGYPGIYVRVANYIDWIIENLKSF